MKNGKRNAACGSGIWIEGDHPLNKALKVPGVRHSNQIGEIAAVIVAAESLPNYCKLKVLTDSRYVIEGLTEHLEKWEDAGWIGIQKRRIAGSTPKRGTSVGVECILRANGRGGTCPSLSFVPPPVLPSPSDSKNRCLFFLPPAAPKNSQFGSTMRPLITTLISSPRVALPACCNFASDSKSPSSSDREALRASAHSLCHSNMFSPFHFPCSPCH